MNEFCFNFPLVERPSQCGQNTERSLSNPRLDLESGVDLLFDPVAPLRLVGLNIDVVDEGAQVLEAVEVAEKLVDVVGHLGLITVLQSESLLVQLADAIHVLADVVVVYERIRGVVCRELDQQDRVALVRQGCGGRLLRSLIRGLCVLHLSMRSSFFWLG